MSVIPLEAAVCGDVLAREIVVNGVPLFGSGTVLTPQRIIILKVLGVMTIAVEDSHRRDMSLKEAFDNLDRRFSHVEDIPLMRHIKSWMKDYLANSGLHHET